MINRPEAERLAAATHMLRPDWPTRQLVTLITELADWPLRDLGTALTYIALDQHLDGRWRSASPYRVKEQGPWQGDDSEAAATRAREARDYQDRKQAISTRAQAIANCARCDDRGYLGAYVCQHDGDRYANAAARGAAAARAAIRPGPTPRDDQP